MAMIERKKGHLAGKNGGKKKNWERGEKKIVIHHCVISQKSMVIHPHGEALPCLFVLPA